MASQLEQCVVTKCEVLEDHHHLIENDDKASVCEGKADFFDRYPVCCELGKRFRAAEQHN